MTTSQRPDLTSLGRAIRVLDPGDSGSPGRVLWERGTGVRGRGHLVPPPARAPEPSHQALQARLLWLWGLSCSLLCFFKVCQSHTLARRRGQSGGPGLRAQPLQDSLGPQALLPRTQGSRPPSHTCVDLRDWRMRRERAFR